MPAMLGIAAACGQRRWINWLNVGQPMAGPIIRQLKRRIKRKLFPKDMKESINGKSAKLRKQTKRVFVSPGCDAIIDVAPGTSCPVVEAMRGSDFCLLVTEPTPFGLYDLKLAVEVARELNIPVGVVVNRDGIGDAKVDEYCAAEGIPILLCIPLDRRIAEAYSEGVPLVEAMPEYGERFQELLTRSLSVF